MYSVFHFGYSSFIIIIQSIVIWDFDSKTDFNLAQM